MNRLQDDLLAEVFKELPLHERSAAPRTYSGSSSVTAMLIHLMCQVTTIASVMQCRARLACVCRHWRTLLIGSHAARVWQKLCVDECSLESGAPIYYSSLIRWCRARGRHVRELRIILAKGRAHVRRSFELRCMSMLVGWCMLAKYGQQM